LEERAIEVLSSSGAPGDRGESISGASTLVLEKSDLNWGDLGPDPSKELETEKT